MDCSIKEKEVVEVEEDVNDYYEWLEVPKNASDDNKTGVTFKGSDDEYFKAHTIIVEMTHKKGDRFVVNGTEMSIADAPKNKSICIAVKPKGGLTGKANLKIYGKNNKGFGTIMIQKLVVGILLM